MDPYSPPADVSLIPNLPELKRKKKFWKRLTWISLSLTLISPLIGLVSTTLSMRKAFAASGSDGIADPKVLSAAIGEALISAAAGLFFALPLLVIFIISCVRFLSYRSKIRSQAY